MAKTGIFTKSSEWLVHLKSCNKRIFHKAERQLMKQHITKVLSDPDLLDDIHTTLGLHKSENDMRVLKAEKGDSVIPEGVYCINCPYLDRAENKENQDNGFCWFMEEGDWQIDGLSLLWDGCKECGIKYDEIELESDNENKHPLQNDIIHIIERWGGYYSLSYEIKMSKRKFKLAKAFRKYNESRV